MSEHRSHRRPCSSTVFFFSFVVVVAIWSSVGVQRTWTTSGRSDKKYCYFFFVQSFGIVRINPKPNPNRCCTWCSKNRNTVLLSLASSSSSSGADASSTSNNNSSNHEQQQQHYPEYRSIAEVVGGLHGGKYQFGDEFSSSSTIPASYYGTGDEAYSGTGTGTATAEGSVVEVNEEEEERPQWAQHMVPSSQNHSNQSRTNNNNENRIDVPSKTTPIEVCTVASSAPIWIQNAERTWEPFYTKIMMRRRRRDIGATDADDDATEDATAGGSGNTWIEYTDDDDHLHTTPTGTTSRSRFPSLSVTPNSGVLAPRGGTQNVCDAHTPYSDRAMITVTHHTNTATITTIEDEDDAIIVEYEYWLVVGTEEEQWSYKLIFEQ